jgi:hypothetical protein
MTARTVIKGGSLDDILYEQYARTVISLTTGHAGNRHIRRASLQMHFAGSFSHKGEFSDRLPPPKSDGDVAEAR